MKQKQKQLIIDIMNADAKDGLYKQKTAVEWLVNALELNELIKKENLTVISEFIEQAKEMEKEQIIYACQQGFYDGQDMARFKKSTFQSAEQYYNETFKSE
jgi:hypothetical protein